MSRPAHGVKLSVSYWAGYALPSPSKHEISGSEVTSGVTCFILSSQGQGIFLISNCTLMHSFKSHSKPMSCMSHPHFSVEKTEAHKARWPTWAYIASEWQSQNFNCNCQLPWRGNVPSDAVPGFGVESISLQHKAHTRPHLWDPPPSFQPSSLGPPWYIPRSHPQVFLTDIKSCSGRGITQLRWLWSARSGRPPTSFRPNAQWVMFMWVPWDGVGPPTGQSGAEVASVATVLCPWASPTCLHPAELTGAHRSCGPWSRWCLPLRMMTSERM